MTNTKPNQFIDFMRFLAALFVVFFHLNQAIPHIDNWYRNFVKYGYLGVPVFFVISGFCIAISIQNIDYFKVFLIKRFFKVFPAYWFSLIILLLAAVFQKLYTGFNMVHHLPKDFLSIIATLSLTTSPFSKIATANWVYWSLTYEVVFYLLASLSLLASKKNMIYLFAVVSLASVTLAPNQYQILFFLDQWPLFCAGFCIYQLLNKSNLTGKLSYTILLVFNLFAISNKFGFGIFSFSSYTICMLLLATYKLNMKENWFSSLGKYAYSTYLIHVPIGVFIFGLFKNPYLQQHVLLNILYDVLIYSVVSYLAHLMYINIEKPFVAYANRLCLNIKIKPALKISNNA
ncbi:MAG: acyltransferase [Pedobacter sp.]|nr:MAG: acyltransferase [Pedobacter sp.]